MSGPRDLPADTRLYLFYEAGEVYILVADSVMRHGIYKMTLPEAGLGRAALELSLDACPEKVQAFFKAILDGEKLRDEFERRGLY